MTLLPLALLLASSMGHTGRDAEAIATALARACDTPRCVVDAAVWAEHESRWQLHPHPYSSDAKAGLALGPWQVHGGGVTLDGQARKWVSLRAWSLATCGNLSALASGSCSRGTRLAASRAAEADGWMLALWYGVWP